MVTGSTKARGDAAEARALAPLPRQGLTVVERNYRVARGPGARAGEIDEKIQAASLNWRLERMTRVDRTVLRLGAYELLARADVPSAVIIDEAVELAKRYGTGDSGAFVNGVLDRIAQLAGRSSAR